MLELQIDHKKNKIFAPLKNQWLLIKPEELIRQKYICYLVNHYGYNLEQMAQEMTVTNAKRGTGAARADIVIWKTAEDKKRKKHALIVVECKAENIKIQRTDYFQGANYAGWARAKFFVTTNEKETKFFKTTEDTIPDEFTEELTGIPFAKDINDEKKINELLSQTKSFTREEFQNLLFACHNVIRNNDKLSPEMAFDEISKILFMKIRYERQSAKENLIFTKSEFLKLKEGDKKVRGDDALPFYQFLFNQTKVHFTKDALFEATDSIKIRESSFLEIVGLLEKYNLSDTSDDIKGIAFEEFLGKTFRGDLGQFFTPRTIVDFMVKILDPREHEIICDPCCGTGGFLIGSFEYIKGNIEKDIESHKKLLRKNLEGTDFEKQPLKKQNEILIKINDAFAAINKDLSLSNEKSRLFDLSFRRIFGTDAEPRSARTAKMNMIMHGDGHGGVHHHDGLININGIFENRFDIIITNPPFGSRVSRDLEIVESDSYKDESKINYYKKIFGEEYSEALKQVTDNIGNKLIDQFDTGKMSNLTEVLFLERCVKLLKPGGRLGIVLPEGILNIGQLQKIREYFESKAKILLIVSIPQEVFDKAGANVKTSLLFMKKFTDSEQNEYDSSVTKSVSEASKKFNPLIDDILKPIREIESEISENTNQVKKLKRLYIPKNENKQVNRTRIVELNKKISFLKKELKEKKLSSLSPLKEINNQKAAEIKRLIKKNCTYEFPVAQAEKAGINSIGSNTENDLPKILEEFIKYRTDKNLWDIKPTPVKYSYKNGSIFRIILGEKEKIYGN